MSRFLPREIVSIHAATLYAYKIAILSKQSSAGRALAVGWCRSPKERKKKRKSIQERRHVVQHQTRLRILSNNTKVEESMCVRALHTLQQQQIARGAYACISVWSKRNTPTQMKSSAAL